MLRPRGCSPLCFSQEWCLLGLDRLEGILHCN